MDREFSQAEYCDLLNTTYALVPDGRSSGTFRFAETIKYGAIPLVVHEVENTPLPFDQVVRWRDCVVNVTYGQLARAFSTILKNKGKARLASDKLQACRILWEKSFSSRLKWDTVFVNAALEAVNRRRHFENPRAH
jgi:hypothetical protein